MDLVALFALLPAGVQPAKARMRTAGGGVRRPDVPSISARWAGTVWPGPAVAELPEVGLTVAEGQLSAAEHVAEPSEAAAPVAQPVPAAAEPQDAPMAAGVPAVPVGTARRIAGPAAQDASPRADATVGLSVAASSHRGRDHDCPVRDGRGPVPYG